MSKKRNIPHTYVIVFYIIVAVAMMTWFVPGGQFGRHTVELEGGLTKEVITENSFEYTQSEPQTWQVFSALFDGFVDKADIIVFILLIGGAFWIMNESKAIDVGIMSFLKSSKKLEHLKLVKALGVNNIILTLIMLMFSLFGAVYGMSEETIAFVIIFVPLAISMGYDSIVGVSLCFVAAGLGFAGALLNPFTIGIAQGLSDIPLFSGIEYRFFSWIVINLVGITWILRYAIKIKKNPQLSLVYEDDKYWREKGSEHLENIKFYTPKSAWITWIALSIGMGIYAFLMPMSDLSIGNSHYHLPILPILTALFLLFGFLSLRKSVHFFILVLLSFTIAYLIVGVMGYGWYVMEIASLFFAMGLASGTAMNYSPNKITKLFIDGVKDITSAAMVVGLAGGIIVILNNGQIIDTLLYYISQSMNDFGRLASLQMMYVFQTIINVLIPSGSAKAALTMPIMSQFSDLIGVSRQATVMAFQFGDGFTNMITPTSGVLIGVLGVAKIPYEKWVKWITPFMIALVLLGAALLIPTIYLNLNGF
ncbi:MAG: short-chain fatty acid transporter [Bacteroidetes bacterium 4572_77]|nr:MAG: short-chain fatty acid transporter [Bacteroidetes bacterium 4572_77]